MEPASDHDLLITLKANFDTFLKQYTIDIKELKDGTTATLTDHEIRLKKIEGEWHDFKTTAYVWSIVASAVGALIFWAITQLPSVLRMWGVIR